MKRICCHRARPFRHPASRCKDRCATPASRASRNENRPRAAADAIDPSATCRSSPCDSRLPTISRRASASCPASRARQPPAAPLPASRECRLARASCRSASRRAGEQTGQACMPYQSASQPPPAHPGSASALRHCRSSRWPRRRGHRSGRALCSVCRARSISVAIPYLRCNLTTEFTKFCEFIEAQSTSLHITPIQQPVGATYQVARIDNMGVCGGRHTMPPLHRISDASKQVNLAVLSENLKPCQVRCCWHSSAQQSRITCTIQFRSEQNALGLTSAGETIPP